MEKPLAGRLFARSTQRLGDITGIDQSSQRMAGNKKRWIQLRLSARWSDDLLMSRTSAHFAVLLLVILVIALSSSVPLPRSLASPWQILRSIEREKSITISSRVDGGNTQKAGTLLAAEVPSSIVLARSPSSGSQILVRAAAPHTIIPERPRAEITHYVVQPGDTIFGVAAKYSLAPETIMWANGRFVEDNPDLLRVGQELTILPVDGVYHQVGGGDTVEKIAAAYKVDASSIIDHPLNELDRNNPQIIAGQWLIVPGGVKPYIPRTVVAYSGPIPGDASKGSGTFGWPAAGQITQGYWDRHRALDIGAWKGAPVLAADSGYVVAAGWDDSGYGRIVVIDHGNGFQSFYAHMQVYYVDVGDSVAKGERIGEVGSTGNSSGPHLHFEVHNGGVQRNPFGFLP